MSNPNIIHIPTSKDKLFGFLSNDSKHGFTLKTDNKNTYIYWPTVTHYIEAKKFEGTQYEDAIRTAHTVTQVRILSREREVRVTMPTSNTNSDLVNKQKIYGNKRVMQHIKSTWRSELENNLYIALSSKFKQHTSLRTSLINTAPLIIEGNGDEISNLTAQILMEIRENFMENLIENEGDKNDSDKKSHACM